MKILLTETELLQNNRSVIHGCSQSISELEGWASQSCDAAEHLTLIIKAVLFRLTEHAFILLSIIIALSAAMHTLAVYR